MGSMAELMCNNVLGGPGGTTILSFGKLGVGWLGLTGLALLCSLLILVAVYMVGMFLRNQQLLSWTKFELFQILGTAVVVLFTAFAIVPGMCSFNMSFLGKCPDPTYCSAWGPPVNGECVCTKPINMYEIVDNYFSKLEEVGYLLFGYMMYMVKAVTLLSRITWTSNPLGIGSTDSPLEAMSQVNSLFFMLFSGFVTSFLLMEFQMRMLEYLSAAVLLYLFPFGVFFRAFEPTRTFGGMLIGLSIAMFLFYPIIMVFNTYIIERTDLMKGLPEKIKEAADRGQSNSGASSPLQGGNVKGEVPPKAENNAEATTKISDDITGGILFLLKPVMLYIIAAVALPVINFIVLVEIVRGASAFFGEEIDVSNLTRLI